MSGEPAPADAAFEEASVVDEDLAYLIDEWVPSLDPPTLRRLSPVLRRLLVQGQYGRAWRTVGLSGEPWVSSTDLEAMLGTIDRRFVQMAFAPPGWTASRVMLEGSAQLEYHLPQPAETGDLMVVMMGYDAGLGPVYASVPRAEWNVLLARPSDELARKIQEGIGRRVTRGMGLSGYLNSLAALVLGHEITRRDVISYVANKLGGAHFDPKREGEAKFALLDKKLAVYKPPNRPEATAVYAELLSIAETLSESSDASRFRAAFAKLKRQARPT